MLTIISVLRDGRHVTRQTDALPANVVNGVFIGAHLAREHADDEHLSMVMVIDRDRVTEHPLRRKAAYL